MDDESQVLFDDEMRVDLEALVAQVEAEAENPKEEEPEPPQEEEEAPPASPASDEWEPTHLAFEEGSSMGKQVVGKLYAGSGRMVFFDPITHKKVKTVGIRFEAITAVRRNEVVDLTLDYDALSCLFGAFQGYRGMMEITGGYSAHVVSFEDRIAQIFIPGHKTPYLVTVPDSLTVKARIE